MRSALRICSRTIELYIDTQLCNRPCGLTKFTFFITTSQFSLYLQFNLCREAPTAVVMACHERLFPQVNVDHFCRYLWQLIHLVVLLTSEGCARQLNCINLIS